MDYCDEFIKIWNETSGPFPVNMKEYRTSDQKGHEKQFDVFLFKMQEVEQKSLDFISI